MNTKALLATLLVIGSSTAALADPIVRDHRDSDDAQAQTVRDHRDADGDRDGDSWKKPVFTVLSSFDRLANGRSVTRINSWRKYSKLELQATKGQTEVEKVMIKFANGRSEVVMPDQKLTPGSPCLTIDLQGSSRITRITVLGHANRRASFEILAA
jgi:hypothetical protein